MVNAKDRTKDLVQKQKELVDEILTNPDRLENIINIQLASRVGFHQYSLRNIALASWQLWCRTGDTAELLAPYKKWNKIETSNGEELHRHVKKGEKALWILAPYVKTITEIDEETGEEKVLRSFTRFKSVPVFDVKQTEGDPLEKDWTSAKYDFTLNEVASRQNVEVILSDGEIRRGYTDGKTIHVSRNLSEAHKISTFFHELAHYHLHFDKNRYQLDTPTKELEAEAVAYLCSTYLGIENKESPAYIYGWTQSKTDEEKKELLKGKGSRVLQTATQIIEELKLSELLDEKKNAPSLDKWADIKWIGVKE